MIPLSSGLQGKVKKFTEMQVLLEEHQFSLGGNWDYHNGSFDRALDEEHKVWLRLPFVVTDGNIDSELSENNAQIKFDQPYVLKHLYNEGDDDSATAHVVGALFDQFQAPVDPDAKVEPRWIEQAKKLLAAVESVIP